MFKNYTMCLVTFCCVLQEQYEDKQERLAFRKVSFWQHMATYLLYFVMLMNVFVTTFGISGGRNDGVFATRNNATRPVT